MENELYSRVIDPAEHADQPTRVVATKEANCFAVWIDSADGLGLINHFCNYTPYARELAIERAAEIYRRETKKKAA